MKFKISWNQVKGLADAYRKHPEKCMRTLQITGETIAEDLEAKAKKNIKWTNRTYQARDSIAGSCEATATNVTIKLEGEAYEDEDKKNINIQINNNGKTLNEDFYTLLILKNDKSDLINKDMKCLIDDKRYEILSIDNELDIYYIIKLKLLVEGDNYEV